jgi:hypothetical protein
VRDVQNLSIETLQSQFKTEALRIQSAVNGGLHEPIITNYPAKSIRKSLRFTGGIQDLELLKSALGDLSKALFVSLSTQSLSAKNLHLAVNFEDTSADKKASFAKPFRGVLGLQCALIKCLLNIETVEPIYRLTVTLPGLTMAKPRQRSLVGVPISDTAFAEDALETVRHKFGNYSVHQGGEHSEPRRVHVLRAWNKAIGWSG